MFIYTCAENGVHLKARNHKAFFEVPIIKVVSTIGAGDSFNAGLLHAFMLNDVTRNNLLNFNKAQWETIIRHAIGFASNVCMSYENYILEEFANKILSEI